ncbi:MAG: nucleoside monophosphate kinase [Patescibacteria group bacterium]|nr:nucleoside monophosphate kinase [Patescibacteria group bacterium]
MKRTLRLNLDVVFYGVAGSGKTTQAERIAEYFDAHFFSIGITLRKIAASQDNFGEKIKQIIDAGEFPDDKTHYQIYMKGMAGAHEEQAIVAEGVGRLLNLKGVFDRIENKLGRKYIVVHLLIDEKLAIERVMQQKGRNDQTPETIQNRFRIYREETLPVIEQHKKERPVLEISAASGIEDITKKIISALKPFSS